MIPIETAIAIALVTAFVSFFAGAVAIVALAPDHDDH